MQTIRLQNSVNNSHNMERTLVILKPCTVQRGLIGEIITRIERKGLHITAMKMAQLDDEILRKHYAHLVEKPFFPFVLASMKAAPVVLMCVEGVDAVDVVHTMAGSTNGRKAAFGTIRGDYSMSGQENIIHTSDSIETAEAELARFFTEADYCPWEPALAPFTYSPDGK